MKRMMMIERNGIRRVDPRYCPHERTVQIMTGHRWAIAGDVTDDERVVTQCLDCGRVLREDGTWGDRLLDKSKEIPF
jgi:hypothetical protein